MVKLIVLLFGLAVGFGGGVYWGHKNPEQAAKISAEEERRFLEAQLAITQKIQAKLEQLSAATSSKPAGSSGFLSSGQAGGSGAAPESEVKEVKADAEQQEVELRRRIDALK